MAITQWIRKLLFSKRDTEIEQLKDDMESLKIRKQKEIERCNTYWQTRRSKEGNKK